MQPIRQADLARELGVSDMQIHRVRKALHIVERPINDATATMIFTACELQNIEVQPYRSCELVCEFAAEIAYAAADPARRVWLVFFEDDKRSAVFPAINGRQLEAFIEAFAVCSVLPLHECVQRAVERLSAMRARLAGRAAA